MYVNMSVLYMDVFIEKHFSVLWMFIAQPLDSECFDAQNRYTIIQIFVFTHKYSCRDKMYMIIYSFDQIRLNDYNINIFVKIYETLPINRNYVYIMYLSKLCINYVFIEHINYNVQTINK